MTETPTVPREGHPSQHNAVPVTLVEEPVQESVQNSVHPDEQPLNKQYEIRPLNNGDTFRVGNMLGKIVGDQRIQSAVRSGDSMIIMTSALGALFDRIPRDLQLFCANLIGIKRDYKEARRKELEEAEVENRDPVSELSLRMQMDNEIIEEFSTYPIGTAQDIIAEVIERDDFEPFLTSSMRLGRVAGKAFSKLQTTTSKNSE